MKIKEEYGREDEILCEILNMAEAMLNHGESGGGYAAEDGECLWIFTNAGLCDYQ